MKRTNQKYQEKADEIYRDSQEMNQFCPDRGAELVHLYNDLQWFVDQLTESTNKLKRKSYINRFNAAIRKHNQCEE